MAATPEPLLISPGTEFTLGSLSYRVVSVRSDAIRLTDDSANEINVTIEQLTTLLNERSTTFRIKPVTKSRLETLREALPGVSKVRLGHALELFKQLEPFLHSQTPPPKENGSLRAKYYRYQRAERANRNGLLTLIPRYDLRGNRLAKADMRTIAIAKEAIEEVMLSKKRFRLNTAYSVYAKRAKVCGVSTISTSTFSRLYKREYTSQQKAEAREGRSGAYRETPTVVTEQAISPDTRGAYPLHIAHLDHKLMEVNALCPRTWRPLGCMWLTCLIDTATGMPLSHCVHFGEPSTIWALAVMQDCVRRHKRLPAFVVMDKGPEFSSTDLELLLARYRVTKVERRAKAKRDGTPIERFFGTLRSSFLEGRAGYRPKDRSSRDFDREDRPEATALWPADLLAERLEQYIHTDYPTTPHRGQLATPAEAFRRLNDALGGARELIPYCDSFIIDCLPTAGDAITIHPRKGIQFGNQYYWSNAFKDSRWAFKKCLCKYVPWDASRLYVWMGTAWLLARSTLAHITQHWTVPEWSAVSEAVREQERSHKNSTPLSHRKLAEAYEQLITDEAYLLPLAKAAADRTIMRAGHLTLEHDQDDASQPRPEESADASTAATFEAFELT